ncbi:FAD-dependent oxidoreductase domain-containing protein 1-like [Pseudomyrmex gracilis]|uniref:FAD-dependent oxidoreductase domain-containing protein 1-like n=1 Tax=Pseudomyrmex gracilis TaxID=219809 RepID=UPI0009951BB9|nr:FAD-dependent oxidoreductase domain-containing protein 1-like [Pseudomyrmex gracilis]
MLRYLTRNRKHVDFFKQCTTIQFFNSTRKQSSKAEDNDKNVSKYKEFVDTTSPGKKMMKSIKKEWANLKNLMSSNKEISDFTKFFNESEIIPAQCDVLIIGGGAIGSSVAYWLKEKFHKEEFRIVVVERDPTYAKASTTLSVGGLRQQFTLEENIEMSLYGAEFMRNVNEHLGIPGQPPIDLCFHPYGYLILASEAGAESLVKSSKLQNSLGAKNIVLTAEKLKKRFPWLNTDGIAAGCLGLEKEGWFDPWSLLCAFKNKASYLGTQYINGEVVAFQYKELPGAFDKNMNPLTKLNRAVIQMNDGEIRSIEFAIVVIAAGAFSGQVAEMANIGTGEEILSVPLPVEPRKRFVYCFNSPDGPGLNTPMTIEPSGLYFRRDGLANNYIAGKSPEHHEEPSIENLDVDYEYFDNTVWPLLARRVSAFEALKIKSSWAGYYEYNTFDENGIIGFHPYHKHLLFATGFSGHGIQQAPAVGRAIAELILLSRFATIDLSRLGFERFLKSEPMREINIY